MPRPIRRWLFRGSCALVGGIIATDIFCHKLVRRSLRSAYTGACIVYEYKYSKSDSLEDIEEIHRRCAERIFDCCLANAGLYVKLGQAIASMNAVLPAPYYNVLSRLQDRAPAISEAEVRRVITKGLGKPPEELFAKFNTEPAATASVAQVHEAWLEDGTKLAVKVVKPDVAIQLPVDLFCYKVLLWGFEKIFDLPVYWGYDITASHLKKELDLVYEGKNQEMCKELFKDRQDIYVPPVYWRYTAARVLTAEWVDACRLSPENIKALDLKPDKVMRTICQSIGDMIFKHGVVHADPHAGNLLIRKHPTKGKHNHQVVMLDHGLYCKESEKFRQEYAEFWRAIFRRDLPEMKRVCSLWGVTDAEFFASLQMFKPYKQSEMHKKFEKAHEEGTLTPEQIKEMRNRIYDRFKKLLGDTNNTPRELIFVGRAMNIVRANNKMLGIPVDRVALFAESAIEGCQLQKESWWSWFFVSSALRVKGWYSGLWGTKNADPDDNLHDMAVDRAIAAVNPNARRAPRVETPVADAETPAAAAAPKAPYHKTPPGSRSRCPFARFGQGG